jgi:hypothetical protein
MAITTRYSSSYTPKPRNDVYTWMLIIPVLVMMAGSALLAFEYFVVYDGKSHSPKIQTAQPPAQGAPVQQPTTTPPDNTNKPPDDTKKEN